MDQKYVNEYKQRTAELISKLTLDEKLSMLTTGHAPVERLGLDTYYIGTEVARGYVGRTIDRLSTVFPQPIGLASTFDRDIMHTLGKIAGVEARAYYNIEKRGGLALWGPTVDMERDPRWGRNEEAYGEDVCLAGELSASYTEGMAGDNGRFFMTIPSLKHFCANNNEKTRANCDAFMPLRLKYDYYYAAFENSVVKGGARSLMTAYNDINGCPAVLNPELKTVLKDKWGLWYTVTDGGDYSQTVTAHRFVPTHSESLALSLKAGSDSMTDNPDLVKNAAYIALEEGHLTEADIDETLANTIFSRFALGQFDECEFDSIDTSVVDCDEHKKANLRATLEQVTLLKNDGILPLATAPKKIAVVGAMADENLLDWYTGVWSDEISVLRGMREQFTDSEIIHDSLWDHVSVKASNGKYLSVDENGLLCATADTVGEDELFELQDWGENWINLFSVKHKRYIRLSDDSHLRLHNRRIYEWFTRETFNLKKVGDKYVAEEILHHRRVYASDNGEISVKPVSNITPDQLFEINVVKSGRERASEIAKNCDFVLYCVGNHPVQVAKEGYDRKTLALNIQAGMATHLASENKNTVMAIISSYPYSINEENAALPAIIYTSHAGMYLGTAVAKTLCGENNPAARTPQTWYKTEHELPDIETYDIETAGTTYMYFKGEPLYPFGYGLSYSTFEYSDLEIMPDGDNYKATLTVKNTSERDGDEVVQIYYTALNSAIPRPIKKLCGFERVHIKAGESVKVEARIWRRMLEVYNVRNGENVLETGDYKFVAGASSADIRLEKTIHIEADSLGTRPAEFAAESFDAYKDTVIKYSKNAGHYIIGKGWGCNVRYDGVDLSGKKTLTVWASSIHGKGRITLHLGNANANIEVAPSNAYDDFKAYTVEIPEISEVFSMHISYSENVSILKFLAE